MPRRHRGPTLPLLLTLASIAPTASRADDPPAPPPPPAREADAIRPSPPVAIPDDPPPHEGSLLDVPVTIEPPDIIQVVALEALPGRPISFDNVLVQPDGTIDLGFYGRVHVRGLTAVQAKAKVVLHLRSILTDDALGLRIHQAQEPKSPLPPPGTLIPGPVITMPDELLPPRPPADLDRPEPSDPPPPGTPDGPGRTSRPTPEPVRSDRRRPSQSRPAASRRDRLVAARRMRRLADPQDPPTPTAPPIGDPAPAPAAPARPRDEPAGGVAPGERIMFESVDPANSDRVVVNITHFNSQVYYVLGDVGTPGRLPITGHDTVLDALNFAGGLIPTAEASDIHLYRPARGGKPAKDYVIDLNAIQRGDARANLQAFAGDRLVVGRNPVVVRTTAIDRAAAPIASAVDLAWRFALLTRSVELIGTGVAPPTRRGEGEKTPPAANPADARPVLAPADRDAFVREWVRFLWEASDKDGGALRDDDRYRQALKDLFERPAIRPAPAPDEER